MCVPAIESMYKSYGSFPCQEPAILPKRATRRPIEPIKVQGSTVLHILKGLLKIDPRGPWLPSWGCGLRAYSTNLTMAVLTPSWDKRRRKWVIRPGQQLGRGL
jgi:hypothetical protein